jgi:hypothetical protein
MHRLKSGFDVMNFFNGDKFEWQWKADLIGGRNGKFKFVNGYIAVGKFIKGLLEDDGTLSPQGQGQYKGHLIKGSINGLSKFE